MQNRTPDLFMTGAVSGFIAKVVHDIVGYAAVQVWPTYLNCIRIAAGLILTREQVMQGGFWTILVGFQIDVIVGIVIATLTVLALEKWGYDHYILKGAMIGLVSWALFYVVLSGFLSSVYPEASILMAEISYISHIIFGVTLTATIVWLRKKVRQQVK